MKMSSTGKLAKGSDLLKVREAAENSLSIIGETYVWQTEVEPGDIISPDALEEVIAVMDLAYDRIASGEGGGCQAHNSSYKNHTTNQCSSHNSSYDNYTGSGNQDVCNNWCPSF
jgi:hypothetical protein